MRLVLAMCLLGPAPAVVLRPDRGDRVSAPRRLPPSQWLANLSAFAVYPLVGGC